MLPFALSNGEVIILVVVIALPLAAIAFAGSGAAYREIGKGTFAMDHDMPDRGGGESTPVAVQEAEIRQMLEAKAYRQAQRGVPVIDVDAEMERLQTPAAPPGSDPALVEEVRQLVVARNERRMRKGEKPLDVEGEIARQLRDLEGLGQ